MDCKFVAIFERSPPSPTNLDAYTLSVTPIPPATITDPVVLDVDKVVSSTVKLSATTSSKLTCVA